MRYDKDDSCFICYELDYKYMGDSMWNAKKKKTFNPIALESVSPQLLIQIISKMDQRSFARMRRSNNNFSALIEKNRRQIKPALFHNRNISYETEYNGKDKVEDSLIAITVPRGKLRYSEKEPKGNNFEYSSGSDDSDGEVREACKRKRHYRKLKEKWEKERMEKEEKEEESEESEEDDEEADDGVEHGNGGENEEDGQEEDVEQEQENEENAAEDEDDEEEEEYALDEESEEDSGNSENEDDQQPRILYPASLSDIVKIKEKKLAIDLELLYHNQDFYNEFVGIYYPSTQSLNYGFNSFYSDHEGFPNYKLFLTEFLRHTQGIVGRKMEFEYGNLVECRGVYEILKPSEVTLHKCEGTTKLLEFPNPNLKHYYVSNNTSFDFVSFNNICIQLEYISIECYGDDMWKEIRRVLKQWTSHNSPLREMRIMGAKVKEEAFEGMNARRTTLRELLDLFSEGCLEEYFDKKEIKKAKEGKRRKDDYIWLLHNDENTKKALVFTYQFLFLFFGMTDCSLLFI